MSDPDRAVSDPPASLAAATERMALPRRSRHFQRRYYALLRRLEEGEAKLVKVSDANNPADYLTKWLSGPKFRLSEQFAENPQNAVGAARPARLAPEWAATSRRGKVK